MCANYRKTTSIDVLTSISSAGAKLISLKTKMSIVPFISINVQLPFFINLVMIFSCRFINRSDIHSQFILIHLDFFRQIPLRISSVNLHTVFFIKKIQMTSNLQINTLQTFYNCICMSWRRHKSITMTHLKYDEWFRKMEIDQNLWK